MTTFHHSPCALDRLALSVWIDIEILHYSMWSWLVVVRATCRLQGQWCYESNWNVMCTVTESTAQMTTVRLQRLERTNKSCLKYMWLKGPIYLVQVGNEYLMLQFYIWTYNSIFKFLNFVQHSLTSSINVHWHALSFKHIRGIKVLVELFNA